MILLNYVSDEPPPPYESVHLELVAENSPRVTRVPQIPQSPQTTTEPSAEANLDAPWTVTLPSLLPPPPPVILTLESSALPIMENTHLSVQHKRSHDFSNGRKRMVLKVNSRGPFDYSIPRFIEGETITGHVELQLDKVERNLASVELFIEGNIENLGYLMESKTIFQHRETLWNISFGDPRAPAPRQPGQPLEPQVLLGHYTWTFSFSIPRYCIPIGFQRAGESQTHKLPPSLSDGDGHISYAIGVKVKRNTTFQPIHRLTTPFDYTPRSEPGAFSSLRQVAYRENTPLLGPDIDPEGWNVFPSVEVSGYDHHKFGRLKCSCTFALATPLSYTRGSVIPVMLMMESEDEKIFGAGLLSKSFFPQVKFSRTLRGRPDEVLATWSVANAQHVPSPCRRVLYGEIKVPRELRPSFDFGPVYIKYMVGTSMFASGAFIPDKEATLFQAEVEIVTDYAPGPRPIRYHESQRDTLDDGRLATRQS